MTSSPDPTVPAAASGARGGLALVALAAVLWALIGLFTPPLLEAGLSAVDIGFWRALIGGGAFLVHAALRSGARVGDRRDAMSLVGFGAVAVGLFYVALAAAIDLGGVSLAWILLYTAPAWVAIAAVLVLREHVSTLRRALVGATVVGVVLVATGGGDGVRVSIASVAWGLTAGWAYATWYIAGKRLLVRLSPVTISTWTMLAGAAVLAPFVRTVPADARTWLLLVGLGLICTYVPVLVYYTGLRTVDASQAAIVATVEPVAALGIGLLVAGERLGPAAAVGAALVLAAAAAASASRDS